MVPHRVVRVEFDGPSQFLLSLGKPVSFRLKKAQRRMRLGKVWLEGQRLPDIIFGAGVISFRTPAKGIAFRQARPCLGEIEIFPKRLLKVAHSLQNLDSYPLIEGMSAPEVGVVRPRLY